MNHPPRSSERTARIEAGVKRWCNGATKLAVVASALAIAPQLVSNDKTAADSTPYHYLRPNIPCLERSFLPTEEQAQRAEACLDDRTAKVALVPYGLSPQTAEAIAAGSEEMVAQATDGMLQPDFVVEMPSVNALNALDAALFASGSHRADCLPTAFDNRNGAKIADTYMQLKAEGYDYVMNIMTLPDCDNLVGGLADVTSGRYASVYGAQDTSADLRESIETTSHEYAHLVGLLGHKGLITTTNVDFINEAQFGDSSFNLDPYIYTSNYHEYGGTCNIMGESNTYLGNEAGNLFTGGMPTMPLDPLQRRALNWTGRVLEDEPDTEFLLGEDDVTIDPATDNYAVLRLDRPVTFAAPTKDNPDQRTSPFDELAFVPNQNCGQGVDSRGLKLYLKNSSDEMINPVEFGYIQAVIPEGGTERLITIGNQTVKLTKNGQTFVLALVTE